MALRALQVSLLVVSFAALAMFASSARRVFVAHVPPDPIESTVLELATRHAHREPMYPDSGTTAAMLPGYPLAVAAISEPFSPTLLHVRVLALFAALVGAALVGLIVHMQTGSWTLAVASGSFTLLAQCLVATPAGIARPQSLMVALALLGLATLRWLTGLWGAGVAGAIFALAIFVEPTAVWLAAGAAWSLDLGRNRRSATFALVAGVLVAVGYVALSRSLGPWFNYSAFDEPIALLQIDGLRPWRALADPILRTFSVWTIAALLSFSMTTEPWVGRGGLWMCAAIASVAGAAASTQSRAFGPESLLPAIALLSVLGPIMAQRVTRHLAAWRDPDEVAGGEAVACAATLLQFAAVLAAAPASPWLPHVVASLPGR
jgi:hypothetical protein